jgi:hypothetical protein
MRKFINIIQKASQIRNRFKNIVRGGIRNNPQHNQNRVIELDNHNDSSNWTYN